MQKLNFIEIQTLKQAISSEILHGGKADNLTLSDIAEKWNTSFDSLREQYNKGIEVESEHTNSLPIKEEITKDHLVEDPKMYDKIQAIEGKTK